MEASIPKIDYDAIIVGGGLAGAITAILLSQNKKRVLLLEKQSYPFHKVCGEYISNETLGFLKSLGFDPFNHGASTISKLRVSSIGGKSIYTPLPLGGFGLSRHIMDHQLIKLAIENGTSLLSSTKVMNVDYQNNQFNVQTNIGCNFSSRVVIGCHGKREVLDKKLGRKFLKRRTRYIGVKYHVRTDYPLDEIGIDHFKGGYCGIVKVEKDLFNVCYLYKQKRNTPIQSIEALEKNILFNNPVIQKIFSGSQFVNKEPKVIGEISFTPKKLIENHILMCGDSANLITPICGNGISMAIHGAKLLSECILESSILEPNSSFQNRIQLEKKYQKVWHKNFDKRLFWGQIAQPLFENTRLNHITTKLLRFYPRASKWFIRQTHGTSIL